MGGVGGVSFTNAVATAIENLFTLARLQAAAVLLYDNNIYNGFAISAMASLKKERTQFQ